jgi:hypothetical protein
MTPHMVLSGSNSCPSRVGHISTRNMVARSSLLIMICSNLSVVGSIPTGAQIPEVRANDNSGSPEGVVRPHLLDKHLMPGVGPVRRDRPS